MVDKKLVNFKDYLLCVGTTGNSGGSYLEF